ncbi:hypothetical protein BJ508DRAFT_311133 [Ascobolus immersus RN42]|uniref:Uncharacterized protein n=1 Tax=Ascobolus immersus RN42 TaxID=1160509 RepID=A0A3N4HV52_ASCIM|nr:hypothetical protein BJ508DRAFT_311133 [Ascobolus immersus RN42]
MQLAFLPTTTSLLAASLHVFNNLHHYAPTPSRTAQTAPRKATQSRLDNSQNHFLQYQLHLIDFQQFDDTLRYRDHGQNFGANMAVHDDCSSETKIMGRGDSGLCTLCPQISGRLPTTTSGICTYQSPRSISVFSHWHIQYNSYSSFPQSPNISRTIGKQARAGIWAASRDEATDPQADRGWMIWDGSLR